MEVVAFLFGHDRASDKTETCSALFTRKLFSHCFGSMGPSLHVSKRIVCMLRGKQLFFCNTTTITTLIAAAVSARAIYEGIRCQPPGDCHQGFSENCP